MTRGDRNIRWIQNFCVVPEGTYVGQRVVLRPWQRQIVKGIYDTATRRAIISFPRKNGKSGLASMLMLLHLCGPEARANSQLLSAAQSKDQASIIFALAAKSVRMNPALSRYIAIRDTRKEILCPELGTLYRALSADSHTAMGLSPIFVIHDELGQVAGPRSDMYSALETATGAHDNPLSVIISTQAPTDADLLSVLIDDAKQGSDPQSKLFLYTCPEGVDPFSEDAMRIANPAYGDFRSADDLKRLAEDAKRMPSLEASFLNLNMNMRVEAASPFVSKSIWDLNAGDVAEEFDGPVFCGLDLSETSDLTCIVAICKIDGFWHVKPTFWLPHDGLAERARKDRVPYDLWHQQGFLETTPGAAVEYGYVAQHIFKLWQTMNIRTVAFDRYGMRHLKPWLIQAGFDDAELEQFVEFGQGFVSMGPAVREFEAALLNGRLRHGNHPVLTMNAANAVTENDPAGNRKLSKKRSRGRIDGMVALAMALSVATTEEQPKPFTSIFDDAEMFPELHQAAD